jgi:hypothetical protein
VTSICKATLIQLNFGDLFQYRLFSSSLRINGENAFTQNCANLFEVEGAIFTAPLDSQKMGDESGRLLVLACLPYCEPPNPAGACLFTQSMNLAHSFIHQLHS